MTKPAYLTTAQVAETLGVGVRAVQKLIESRHLKATQFGRFYLVAPADLADFLKDRPAPGWPKGKPRKRKSR